MFCDMLNTKKSQISCTPKSMAIVILKIIPDHYIYIYIHTHKYCASFGMPFFLKLQLKSFIT
jgi:hypothetical protein